MLLQWKCTSKPFQGIMTQINWWELLNKELLNLLSRKYTWWSWNQDHSNCYELQALVLINSSLWSNCKLDSQYLDHLFEFDHLVKFGQYHKIHPNECAHYRLISRYFQLSLNQQKGWQFWDLWVFSRSHLHIKINLLWEIKPPSVSNCQLKVISWAKVNDYKDLDFIPHHFSLCQECIILIHAYSCK